MKTSEGASQQGASAEEAVFEVSFWKALMLSAWHMALLIVAIAFLIRDLPAHDPMFIISSCVMFFVATVAFAFFTCLMLRCKISPRGLSPGFIGIMRPPVPWEEIRSFRKAWGAPLYMVKGRGLFGRSFFVPAPFLLASPDAFKELFQRYLPADNLIRKKLAI